VFLSTEVKTPPSQVDNSAGYVDYVALYDFSARNFDELSFKAGDHVMVNIFPYVH